MNTCEALVETEIPSKIQDWIADLCSGQAAISVGHRMFAVNENIDNIPLERLLYLIRNSLVVREYVGDDETRRAQVAGYTAECVSQFVLNRFAKSQYPGD